MKAFICIVAITACFTLQDRASAGFKVSSPSSVWISDAYSYASGDLAGVRASTTNTVEYIGCYRQAFPGGNWIGCQARNATGTSRSCYSNDPNMADAVAGISDDGYMFFMWDASGTCTYLEVDKFSYYGPRQP